MLQDDHRLATHPFRHGPIEIDPAHRSLRVDGQPLALRGRAFDLLAALVARGGALVTKDELLDAVWGQTIVEEANLHVHVSALRKLLGPQAIATIPGRGYRLVAPPGVAVAPGPPPAAAGADLGAADARSEVAPLPLIGREPELAELRGLLQQHRLVTITGAGGIGKTHLAATALWQARGAFADPPAMVDLAAVHDPALVAGAIATALKLSLGGSSHPVEALAGAARTVEALLLLDNAEHLIAAVAAVTEALLRAAPALRILVTSQAPLHLKAETLLPLGGLAVPAGAAPIGVGEALAHGAVALFDERLQSADRRLRVDEHNLAAVLEICRRLDGLPLAIEFAAARCPLLGVGGVAQRLGDRFRLLRSKNRAAPSRQLTLGAVLDFSHGLLSAEQQTAFRQLGVFSGSFTLAMAMQVVDVPRLDDIDRIELLAELADRSLLAVEAGEQPRYRLLETTRLYALERLAESGEDGAARARHAHALGEHFEQAWRESWTLPEAVFVARYEPDLDNLRAALDHSLVHAPATAVALAGAATRLWRFLSLHPEAIRRCEAAAEHLDAATPPATEARLWEGIAQVYSEISHARSRPVARRAAELYASVGDARGRYLALAHIAFSHCGHDGAAPEAEAAFREMQGLEDPAWPAALRLYGRKVEGSIASDAGHLAAVRTATQARLELASACGARRDIHAALGNLADLALMAGDAAEAVRLGRALLQRLQRRDAATRAIALCNLLLALLAQGDLAQARATAAEIVDELRRLDFMFVAYVGDAWALLAAREARWPAAAKLIGYADAVYLAQGQQRELNEARARDEALAALAAHHGAADIEAWRHEGAALDTAGACGLALALPEPDKPGQP